MPVITDSAAPRFDVEGTHVVGLASPSRGATETSTWRLRLDPGSASPPHSLDREEIFVVLAGSGRGAVRGRDRARRGRRRARRPRGPRVRDRKPRRPPFDAVVVLPAGARATVDGVRMVPPWAE